MNATNIEVLARRRLALVEQREAIDAQLADVDAAITDAIEIGGRIDIDGETVFRVQQRRTFSVDLAKEHVPEELLTAATVETVDAKLLQTMLPPALRDVCMKPGKVSVVKATTR